MKHYGVVDLDRTQLTVCLRDEQGSTRRRQWRIEQLPEFVEQATSTTARFHAAVIDGVARVVVMNPHPSR